jgi:uncharacterized protein DUF4386
VQPRALARLGGALYLAIIVIGAWGEMFVRGRLVVSGDAAATAANIRAHEPLWRAHIAAEFFLLICAIVLLQILYILLRPAGRDLAQLAVLLNIVSIAVEAATAMTLIEALFAVEKNDAALAGLLLRSHAYGFGVALIFFGCFCLIAGFLIFRSGYFPKTIGVLMEIAGVCYLINSLALILSPALANRLFPAILLPPFIGELSLCLWLLIRGVNVEKFIAMRSALR